MSTRPAPTSRLSPLNLSLAAKNQLSHGFFQWCVVTPDLPRACEQIRNMYGVPVWLFLENAPLNQVMYGGQAIDIRVNMAFGYIGDTNVEIIQPREEGDDNLYREFLRERPRGGFHHLGFKVYNFEEATSALEAQFGPTVQRGQFGTGGTKFAYYDTREATGLYTEVICFDQASEALLTSLRDGNPPGSL